MACAKQYYLGSNKGRLLSDKIMITIRHNVCQVYDFIFKAHSKMYIQCLTKELKSHILKNSIHEYMNKIEPWQFFDPILLIFINIIFKFLLKNCYYIL